MRDQPDKIKRMEEIIIFLSRLARVTKRRLNQLRRTINTNTDIFDDRTIRNEKNVDKLYRTVKELMGEEIEEDRAEKPINDDSKRIFI